MVGEEEEKSANDGKASLKVIRDPAGSEIRYAGKMRGDKEESSEGGLSQTLHKAFWNIEIRGYDAICS